MGVVPNDIWRYIFTDAIQPRDYTAKLALSRTCSRLRQLYNNLVERYVNAWGRIVYHDNSSKYDDRCGHGVVRAANLYADVWVWYDLGSHHICVKFLGEKLINIYFNCRIDTSLYVVVRLYVHDIGEIAISMGPIKYVIYYTCDANDDQYCRTIDGVTESLENRVPTSTAAELWKIAMGLRDVTNFIETKRSIIYT